MVNARECCKCFTVSLVPVTVFCLAVVFLGGIALLPTLFVELAYLQQYGIVIDAGSTHTSFYLYGWDLPKPNGTAMGRVFEDSVLPLHPAFERPAGISTFINNPNEAGPSIKNCINSLIRSAPKEIRGSIATYLGATAGMRLVEKWNSSISDEILASVNSTLSQNLHGNSSVRIISGKEEASSAWVTVNYLSGSFIKSYPWKRSVDTPPTMGALDMGGASMQISFADSNPPDNFSDQVTVFGSSHTLYSRSYLCYGFSEALRRVNAKLAQKTTDGQVITHPCLPRGASMNVTGSYLFGKQHYCTNEFDSTPRNITYNGSGNATECSLLTQQVMNFSNSVPAEGNFKAFSAFYQTAEFFNITNLNKTVISRFEDTVMSFCNSTLNEATQQSRIADRKYIIYYCFSGQYLLHVFKNGFGFNSTSVKEWSVNFADNVTVDGTVIHYGWSLGYMMLRTQDIPLSPSFLWQPYSVVDLVVGMLVLSILCFVFVVFFIFTCTACLRALKTNATGYSNIA